MLDDIGLSYEEINIEEQDLTREDLLNLTGGFTVPQIIINDKSIGGFGKLLQFFSQEYWLLEKTIKLIFPLKNHLRIQIYYRHSEE